MNLVDIFSGCGGFSLGAHQVGFKVVAAFDNDPILASSYPYNFPNSRMILEDVTKLDGNVVRAAVAGRIDGICGGPPCQGFSTIGKRNPEDPRRHLLGQFFRIVQEVQPSFFVMENVCGLAYSASRDVLDSALRRVEDNYAVMGPYIWNAARFGAATNRSRLFVVGIHKDYGEALTLENLDVLRRPPATVRAAIKDLEGAVALGEENGFDLWRIAHIRSSFRLRPWIAITGRSFHWSAENSSYESGRRAIQRSSRGSGRFSRSPPTFGLVWPMPDSASRNGCRPRILPVGPTHSSG